MKIPVGPGSPLGVTTGPPDERPRGRRRRAVVAGLVARGATLMGAAKGKITAGGEFEINHPGGACWGNDAAFPQVTPDILPGDKVEVKFAEGARPSWPTPPCRTDSSRR